MPTFPQHRRPWLAAGGGQGKKDSSSSDSDSDDVPVLSSNQKHIQAQKKRIADLESQLKEAKAQTEPKPKPAAKPKPKPAAKCKRRKPRKNTLSPEKRQEKQDWGVWTSTVKRALLPASASTNGKKITVVDQLKELTQHLHKIATPYYDKDGKATTNWDTKGGYLGAVKAVALKLYQDKKQDLDFKYTANPKDSEEKQAEKKATVARCQEQWNDIKRGSVEGGGGGARRRRKRKRAAGGGAAAATEVSSVASSSLPRASRRVQVGDLALR